MYKFTLILQVVYCTVLLAHTLYIGYGYIAQYRRRKFMEKNADKIGEAIVNSLRQHFGESIEIQKTTLQ